MAALTQQRWRRTGYGVAASVRKRHGGIVSCAISAYLQWLGWRPYRHRPDGLIAAVWRQLAGEEIGGCDACGVAQPA